MAIEDLRTRHWVLLPGTLCTEAVFDEFLDLLEIPRTQRMTIMPRYPSIEEYTDTLASVANNAVVCGFSLGAIVAAHHMDQLSPARTVLFGLNPYPDNPEKAEGRRALAKEVSDDGGAVAMARRLPLFNGEDPQKVRTLVMFMADVAAQHINAQTQLALTRPGAIQALSRAESHIMVLTGTNDVMAPMAQGQAAADAAPQGRFKAIPGLGHYALLEDPSLCARCFLELDAEY